MRTLLDNGQPNLWIPPAAQYGICIGGRISDARMSPQSCIVLAYLSPEYSSLLGSRMYPGIAITGLFPPSMNNNLNDINNSADRSSDDDAGPASIKILIIDDDATMREAIGYIMEDLDVEFDATSSGEAGLAKLDKQSYDLVLLDLVLRTGLHGTEIFRKLRNRSKDPTVVFMTASGPMEPVFVEAAELQQFILRKPFTLGDIAQVIDEVRKKSNQS